MYPMTLDKRIQTDRRKKPTPPISRFTLRGRRFEIRRAEDDRDYYTDRYPYNYLFLILGVVLLSTLDAILTLHLLRGGGVELNPLMSILIEKNASLFMAVKLFMTSICLIFLLVHKNFHVFGNFKIAYFIYSVFLMYILLICYEIYLYVRHL